MNLPSSSRKISLLVPLASRKMIHKRHLILVRRWRRWIRQERGKRREGEEGRGGTPAKEEEQRKKEVREKEEAEKQAQKEDDDLDLEDLSLLAKLEHEIRDKIQENEATLHELDMTDEELKLAAEMAGMRP